jgi:hypothetical protein
VTGSTSITLVTSTIRLRPEVQPPPSIFRLKAEATRHLTETTPPLYDGSRAGAVWRKAAVVVVWRQPAAAAV